MSRLSDRWCRASLAVVYLLLTSNLAWGSTSGLNNIPTTDVAPRGEGAVQTWLNVAKDGRSEHFTGFKAGLTRGLEVGTDWKAYDQDAHSHATVQAKQAFDIIGDKWKAAVGIANLSESREHNGEYFPYVATSLKHNIARLHLGYAPERYNEAFFGGIDKTVTFRGRNLQLRADAIQINDAKDVLYSAGLLCELGRRGVDGLEERPSGKFVQEILSKLVLEGWVSMPSTGGEEGYTVKLNYKIKF